VASTTTEATMLTLTAIINTRPRTLDHNCGRSPASPVVLSPFLAVASTPLAVNPDRSPVEDQGGGATSGGTCCQRPLAAASALCSADDDVLDFNQFVLNAPS